MPDEEIVQAISMILNAAYHSHLMSSRFRLPGVQDITEQYDIRARFLMHQVIHKWNVLEIKGDRMQPAHA